MHSGLNKKCMIYSVSVESNEKNIRVPKTEVATHDKYITKCLFFGSDQQVFHIIIIIQGRIIILYI